MFAVNEKQLFGVLSLAVGIYFLSISIPTNYTSDTGDGIQHYMLARFAYLYPHLFLDLWGKPVFNVLASPFAQFGIQGIHFFNLVCSLLCCRVCFSIAAVLGLRFGWLLVLLICFSPIYFLEIPSGLTEPLFCLTMVLSVYLLLKKDYVFAAALVSFLPYTRQEGYLMLPIFGLFLVLNKHVRAMPFLLLATVLLSVVGSFYHKDLFWLFHQNPYKDASNVYGHGELLHFVNNTKLTFGLAQAPFLLIGLLFLGFKLIKNKFKWLYGKAKNEAQEQLQIEVLVVAGYVVVFFVCHSVWWWQGWFASLGLLRVMACVVPLVALLVLRGLNVLLDLMPQRLKFLEWVLALMLAFLVVITPFKQYYYPLVLGGEEQTIAKASDYIKNNQILYSKVYFSHPFFVLLNDIDPFDTQKSDYCWSIDKENPEKTVKKGEIVVYDTHYAPNDMGLKLELLTQNPNFELLQKFVPQEPFVVLGGYNYEVYIFRKK